MDLWIRSARQKSRIKRRPPAMRARETRVGGDGEDEAQRDEDRPGEADEVRRAPEVHVLSDVNVPPLVERSAGHGQKKPGAAQRERGGGAVASPPPGKRPRTDEAVGCDAGVHEEVRGREEAVAADRPVPGDVPEQAREAEPAGAQGEREGQRDGIDPSRHRRSANAHGSLKVTRSSTWVRASPASPRCSTVYTNRFWLAR